MNSMYNMVLKMLNFSFLLCRSASSQISQQRKTYQEVLFALWPKHREVDHWSNHQHYNAEHKHHQLLSILLQHTADDVVYAEHCTEKTRNHFYISFPEFHN